MRVVAVGLFLGTGTMLVACPSTDALLVNPPATPADAGIVTTPPSDAATEEAAPVPLKECALYVSPTGSDDDPGTKERPLRTLAKATDGALVCLYAGQYENLVLGTPNVRLTAAGDAKKSIVAGLVVTATGCTIEDLTFEKPPVAGTGGGPIASISVRAGMTTLRGLEVTGDEANKWSCIRIEDADDVTVDRCRLHHCEQGVVTSKSVSRLKVTSSLVYRVGDDGIQLNANANGCEVRDLIVYDALNAISLFSDDTNEGSPSNSNTFTGSVLIARASAFRTSWGTTEGANNRLENNCLVGATALFHERGSDAGLTQENNVPLPKDTAIFKGAILVDDPKFEIAPDSGCGDKGPK